MVASPQTEAPLWQPIADCAHGHCEQPAALGDELCSYHGKIRDGLISDGAQRGFGSRSLLLKKAGADLG